MLAQTPTDLNSSFALSRLLGWMASTSSLVKSLKVEIGCIYNLGMDIVQKIETFGTQAGRTTKKIVIARSGEL
jgi:hypothetical protein